MQKKQQKKYEQKLKKKLKNNTKILKMKQKNQLKKHSTKKWMKPSIKSKKIKNIF
jgi:hypothetical protein